MLMKPALAMCWSRQAAFRNSRPSREISEEFSLERAQVRAFSTSSGSGIVDGFIITVNRGGHGEAVIVAE